MSTYTLKTPVEFQGKTHSALTARTPKVADLMVTDNLKGELTQSIALMAALTDVPIQVIKGMDLKDFKGLSEVVAPFLSDFHESTENGGT